MAKYRHVSCSFWTDATLQEYQPDEKYFYLFLLTNSLSTQCGITEISITQIAQQTGCSISEVERLLDLFENTYQKIRYNRTTNELAIKNWAKYNYSTSPKVITCIKKELLLVKDRSLIEFVLEREEERVRYSMHTLSQEKEKQKEKEKQTQEEGDEEEVEHLQEFSEDFPEEEMECVSEQEASLSHSKRKKKAKTRVSKAHTSDAITHADSARNPTAFENDTSPDLSLMRGKGSARENKHRLELLVAELAAIRAEDKVCKVSPFEQMQLHKFLYTNQGNRAREAIRYLGSRSFRGTIDQIERYMREGIAAFAPNYTRNAATKPPSYTREDETPTPALPNLSEELAGEALPDTPDTHNIISDLVQKLSTSKASANKTNVNTKGARPS